MDTLRVRNILPDRILVSRESARLLEDPLRAVIAGESTAGDDRGALQVTVDFEGIEGIAPSFLDELVRIFESAVAAEVAGRQRSLIVKNPPTRLSLKFEAIARGHGMSVQALPDGSWLLADRRPDPA
jgi:hypothetical protein